MATIAKASINLVSISDAYSVSLQPSNITINADPYGKNPNLTNAYTIVSLYCGDDQVPIQSGNIIGSSMGPEYTKSTTLTQYGNSLKLQITGVSETDLDGWREIEIFTKAGQRLVARFSYTIVRETTMLDWILEWDKNYTQITGDHVASPNAFIGGKDTQGLLSGVYIGADMPNHTIGIYAVKDCPALAFVQGNIDDTEIFHLNEKGGKIGGWEISKTGLITSTSVGKLEILSNGTIHHLNNKDASKPFWELKSDGSGSLANGNIYWDTSGDATFNGKLTTKEGEIGGWSIGQTALYNQSVLISSSERFIGIRNSSGVNLTTPSSKTEFYTALTKWGGVAMYFTDKSHYGLEGWIPTIVDTTGEPLFSAKIFSLGAENIIAGWRLNENALYKGARATNTAGTYTTSSGDITIGSNGIRGFKWYIDSDGEADFMSGLVHFGPTKSQISGWKLQANRLCTDYTVIASEENGSGFFISSNTITGTTASDLITEIQSNGGIYLTSLKNAKFELAAFKSGGNVIFRLSSSNTSKIAAWNFDDVRMYIGQPSLLGTSDYTAFANSLVLDSRGIHGPAWYILAEGSGSLANGAITWSKDGDVTLANSVKIAWSQLTDVDENVMTKSTYIDANGVFTGKVKADLIQAGTISTASITSEGKWALNSEGDGYLASKNITWNADGDLTVNGDVTVHVLRYNVDLTNRWGERVLNQAFEYIELGTDGNTRFYDLPHLADREFRVIKLLVYRSSRMSGDATIRLVDSNDKLFLGTTNQVPSNEYLIESDSYYELIGYVQPDDDNRTYWHIIPLYLNS